MKKINFVFIIVGILFTQSLLAVPIVCQTQNNPYSLSVQSNQKAAKLYYNDNLVQFGDLTCTPTQGHQAPGSKIYSFLVCFSARVADAGYFVTISQNMRTGQVYSTIDKVAFHPTQGGHVTKLPCKLPLRFK